MKITGTEEPQTYPVRATCSNCNHTALLDIPKGTPITETACPLCGCKTLEKAQ